MYPAWIGPSFVLPPSSLSSSSWSSLWWSWERCCCTEVWEASGGAHSAEHCPNTLPALLRPAGGSLVGCSAPPSVSPPVRHRRRCHRPHLEDVLYRLLLARLRGHLRRSLLMIGHRRICSCGATSGACRRAACGTCSGCSGYRQQPKPVPTSRWPPSVDCCPSWPSKGWTRSANSGKYATSCGKTATGTPDGTCTLGGCDGPANPP